MKKKNTTPLLSNKDVELNPDLHIDQDFLGFPHLPATEKMINPKTITEKKMAGVIKK